jgi:cytochrome c oxidase cbb3-type subunit 2
MKKLFQIAGGSTAIYICLAILMGVLPGIELSRTPPGPGVLPLTPLQAEGRDVYVAEGCSYCHTQQVRPFDQDKVFGRPSAPGDFAYQTPELLGSERTGPDLTNIGVRQPSAVWQYMHLYNPRSVVPQSIMPPFAWMFDVVDSAPTGVDPVPVPKPYAPAHGVVIPTPRAVALVAYLASLKQPPLPHAVVAANKTSDGRSTSPHATVSAPAPAPDDDTKGLALFTAHCSACHQANGEGIAGVFPPLAANAVVNSEDATKHIRVVLDGVHGETVGGVAYASPMPPFADVLDDADIASIVNHERSAWGNNARRVTAAQVALQRATPKPTVSQP